MMLNQTEQPLQITPANDRKVSPGMILFLLFPLFGIAAALIVALTSPANQSTGPALAPVEQSAPRLLNFPAPEFTLATLDGETVNLADYKGRVVFVNFWATWCGPCIEEMPVLQAFNAEQDADGPIVLAINVQETATVINDFFQRNAIGALPVLLDPEGTASRDYGIINMPTTYIIDETGQVRYMKLGEVTRDLLYSYLDELAS